MEITKIDYDGLPDFVLIKPTKKYAILFQTGTGVVEDLHKQHGFICESDDSDHIRGIEEKLSLAFNGFYNEHKNWAAFSFILFYNNNGVYVRD